MNISVIVVFVLRDVHTCQMLGNIDCDICDT